MDKVLRLPQEIDWHFIGHIQSNKVKKLLSVAAITPERPNPLSLHIETVDTPKLAEKLNKEWAKVAGIPSDLSLQVLVQVLSSDEDTKHGCDPEKVPELVSYIIKECPRLRFRGLMAMGKIGDIDGFRSVYQLKQKLIEEFKLDPESLILSMGTSADFEEAIVEGATEVRVGTVLFGARNYPQKPSVGAA